MRDCAGECWDLRPNSSGLSGRPDHPVLARVVEDAAGVDDWLHVAERFQLMDLAGFVDLERRCIEVHGDDIAGLQFVTEPAGGFTGIKFAGGDAIPEEDAG